ncbi:MAG: two-component sensor histidine kinase, partial [Pseudonocardia sp.]|nr:two-component sensor histidine kinase [Pseudonocardia sp.]
MSDRPEMLDRFSLRSRIGILAALVAGLAVVLVSLAAFLTVRSNILATLDSNLLQRAVFAAQSELADPEQLSRIPPEILGAGDIRIALVTANGQARSAEGAASSPPIEAPELAVAQGVEPSSVRTSAIDRDPYRV